MKVAQRVDHLVACSVYCSVEKKDVWKLTYLVESLDYGLVECSACRKAVKSVARMAESKAFWKVAKSVDL